MFHKHAKVIICFFSDKALSKEIMIKNRFQSQILELGVRGKKRISLNEVIIVPYYLQNLSLVILANLK